MQERVRRQMTVRRVALVSPHTCPLAELGSWETGGMNVYLRELGQALAQQGVQVDTFTRRQACEAPDVEEYVPGARVIHLDAGPQRHLDKYDVLDYLPDFACALQRWRTVSEATYDVVHAHYWLAGRIAPAFAQRWNAPLVTTFHTLGTQKNAVAEQAIEREEDVRNDVERRLFSASDLAIASTEIDRTNLIRAFGTGTPIEVIPGGVNLQRFQPRARAEARAELGLGEGPIVLFVGRLQRLKGVEVLLRSLAEIGGDEVGRPPVQALLVGGKGAPAGGRRSPEAAEAVRLQKLAAQLGISDRVTFVGAVQPDRLPLYYGAADVTVMPSSYESFGLVAVESLACGTPVVASRVGGLTSIVREGETGFLVPWRDPRLFAEAIERVIWDPALRAQMAAAARPSVLRFGWDGIAARHIAAYDALRAGQPRAVGRHA
ncbi:MAG: glycosyltransferase [Chloroflexi bacterium]|nr:glycosyltransferase [Chloroflexota bacterium]